MLRKTKPDIRRCEWLRFAVTHLKDLRFSELSSTEPVLSRTAWEGEDRRMREVAGAPRWVLGEPSLSLSKRCLTGSYSISRCRVWLVQWIRSSTLRKAENGDFLIEHRITVCGNQDVTGCNFKAKQNEWMTTELGGVTTVGIKVSVPSNPLPAEECIEDGMMEEREEFQELQVKLFNKEITSAF